MQSGKSIQKPTLRRSEDIEYERFLGESVSVFDVANDPPVFDDVDVDASHQTTSTSSSHDSFYQLSMNTIDGPAALESESQLASKQFGSSEISMIENHDSTKLLHVVKINSSSEQRMDDADEFGAIDRRSDSNGSLRRIYSTEKPQASFSLVSPIKKENTLDSTIDCSFDANFQSVDVDKSAAQDSVAEQWTTFEASPFKHNNTHSEVSLSSGTEAADDDAEAAFAPSAFAGLETTESAKITCDADVVYDLLRQVKEINTRLASLERVVHGMGSQTVRVSESSYSSEPDTEVHDVAFIIENTELLNVSSVNEDITCTHDWGDESKGSKFSMKRMLKAKPRLFSGKSKRKTLMAEV